MEKDSPQVKSQQRPETPPHSRNSDRTLPRVALAGLIVIVAIVCFSKPGESAWLPGCLFYKLTGLYCPGCGSTRMLLYLVHGHFNEAFRHNALTMLILPIVFYSLIRKSIASRLPALPGISRRWITAFTVFIIVFTVSRNIPAEPFCKLAPGGICRGHIGSQ